jgi:hypothetical protein
MSVGFVVNPWMAVFSANFRIADLSAPSAKIFTRSELASGISGLSIGLAYDP